MRNIGPAIAGGTITYTHKENERLNNMKLRNLQMQEKYQLQQQLQQQQQQFNSFSPSSNSPKMEWTDEATQSPKLSGDDVQSSAAENSLIKPESSPTNGDSLYSDFININENNHNENSSSSINIFNDILSDDQLVIEINNIFKLKKFSKFTVII